MKIKLKRPLWNHKTNETIEVNDTLAMWAINKNYAEQVIEPIKPIIEAKVVTEYETKVIEPEVKKRGRKAK